MELTTMPPSEHNYQTAKEMTEAMIPYTNEEDIVLSPDHKKDVILGQADPDDFAAVIKLWMGVYHQAKTFRSRKQILNEIVSDLKENGCRLLSRSSTHKAHFVIEKDTTKLIERVKRSLRKYIPLVEVEECSILSTCKRRVSEGSASISSSKRVRHENDKKDSQGPIQTSLNHHHRDESALDEAFLQEFINSDEDVSSDESVLGCANQVYPQPVLMPVDSGMFSACSLSTSFNLDEIFGIVDTWEENESAHFSRMTDLNLFPGNIDEIPAATHDHDAHAMVMDHQGGANTRHTELYSNSTAPTRDSTGYSKISTGIELRSPSLNYDAEMRSDIPMHCVKHTPTEQTSNPISHERKTAIVLQANLSSTGVPIPGSPSAHHHRTFDATDHTSIHHQAIKQQDIPNMIFSPTTPPLPLPQLLPKVFMIPSPYLNPQVVPLTPAPLEVVTPTPSPVPMQNKGKKSSKRAASFCNSRRTAVANHRGPSPASLQALPVGGRNLAPLAPMPPMSDVLHKFMALEQKATALQQENEYMWKRLLELEQSLERSKPDGGN